MTEEEAQSWLTTLPNYDSSVQQRLELFCSMLAAENLEQNLIAPSTVPQLWSRHVADSAQLLKYAPTNPRSWLDIGTGAGFPGVVISCFLPLLPMTVVEPRKRRVAWLESLKEALSLENMTVAGCRAEVLGEAWYHVISARALASLPKLLEVADRFSTRDTVWLLPKGASSAQELLELPRNQRAMFHVEQSVTDEAAKILVGKGSIG